VLDVMAEGFGRHHARLGRGRPAIAGDAENAAFRKTFGDAGGGVARVQADGGGSKAEALALPVEA
jgi:hypothetical protein